MNTAIPPHIEFGTLPRTCKYGDGTFPKYEDRFELIPRGLWKPVSLSRHVRIIYGQLDGMCTSNGASEDVMIDRSIRGRSFVELSPENLYGQHSKWGTGSTLDENLQSLINIGVCSREKIPQSMWNPEDWPSDWPTDAANYRMIEYIDGNKQGSGFDAIVTGLQLRKPGLIGVRWPGGGGHAVAVTEYAMLDGAHCIRGPNSWEESWGGKPNYSHDDLEWLNVMGYRPLSGGFWTLTERECDDFDQYGCWISGGTSDAQSLAARDLVAG